MLLAPRIAGAQQAAILGTWKFDLKQDQKKEGPRIVIVRPDSSASYGTQTVRWRIVGDSLALALGGEWVNYRLKLKGKNLTLSGGDLNEPVTFQRVGPRDPTARYGAGAAGSGYAVAVDTREAVVGASAVTEARHPERSEGGMTWRHVPFACAQGDEAFPLPSPYNANRSCTIPRITTSIGASGASCAATCSSPLNPARRSAGATAARASSAELQRWLRWASTTTARPG